MLQEHLYKKSKTDYYQTMPLMKKAYAIYYPCVVASLFQLA